MCVTLDSKLTFSNHITEKIKIARRNIGIISHLSSSVPHKTLDQIYKSLIRPHLDYASIIYHIPHKLNPFDTSISLHSLMEEIEKTQHKAALAIAGCWRGSSRQKLFEELGWAGNAVWQTLVEPYFLLF